MIVREMKRESAAGSGILPVGSPTSKIASWSVAMAVSADLSPADRSRPDRPSATEQLADFVSRTKADDLPARVVDETIGYYLDWLGCAIAGLPSKPGIALTRHTAQQ